METILLGGVIHPICSESFEEGYIILKNGRISDLGRGYPGEEAMKNREVLDCREKHILPGLIDAHTHLGILGRKSR
jgi:imidazolonepropionase-like amidohydrolase